MHQKPVTKILKCLTAQWRVSLAVHLGERPVGELFLDWSQVDRDGDTGFSEVSLGSSEEKNADRAGLVVEADNDLAGLEGEDRGRLSWADLSFTEPCQDHTNMLTSSVVLYYIAVSCSTSHLLIPGIFGEEKFVQQAGPLLSTLFGAAS